MILVIGATGHLGGEICRRLREGGKEVRALVRSTSQSERVERLRAMGVVPVEGDLKDEKSLSRACEGVDTVISTASATVSRQDGDSISSVDRDGQLRLIQAARSAQVDRFVFISFSGNIEVDSPLRDAKRAVEERLRGSGMTFTILRPSVFMEVWLSPALGFDPSHGIARVYGSGERKVSYVSLGDVAEFAVRCLESPDTENATIEIGGPEAVSQLEAVRTFEQVLGKSITVEHVPEAALRAQREGSTNEIEKTFAGLMEGYANGDEIDMSGTLARVPVRLTSVREYAQGFASPGATNS